MQIFIDKSFPGPTITDANLNAFGNGWSKGEHSPAAQKRVEKALAAFVHADESAPCLLPVALTDFWSPEPNSGRPFDSSYRLPHVVHNPLVKLECIKLVKEGYPWRRFGRIRYSKSASNKIKNEKLRKALGPEEVDGFQSTGVSRPERLKDAPDWMINDEQLQRFRRHLSIPPPGTPDPNNERGKFACLYWYYRNGITVAEIAEESGMDKRAIENVIARRTERGNNFFKKLEAKAERLRTTLGEQAEVVG